MYCRGLGLASLLLPLLLVEISGTWACGSRKGGKNKNNQQTNPQYKNNNVSIREDAARNIRLRRWTEKEEDSTRLPQLLNAEIFGKLDRDENGVLSSIDWSLEGGLIKDFAALLTDLDTNGDESISPAEFQTVKIILRHPAMS